ncbi:MAG: hypothetical protein NVSMB47_18600 [Polyangiales bacterium]
MDLPSMLEKCRRDQWRLDDLDWSKSPRPMSADDEIAIVQYFTDMVVIERLAGALFREQERRVADPTLKKIFRTFVVDEERHAQAAERLARFYDVHRYRAYRTSTSLERFFPHFLAAIRELSDDVANAYVTAGELILDIALLRSIDDYVADDMSRQVMHLVNRDESRHIAVDYRMVEYYASPEYRAKKAAAPRSSLRARAHAWWTFANVIGRARPFFRDVFFTPMQRVDPTRKRLREAMRRFQLLGNKPGVAEQPFGRFLLTLQAIHEHPIGGALFGNLVARLAGVEPEFMAKLNSDEELSRAQSVSYDALADEALAVKYEGDAARAS